MRIELLHIDECPNWAQCSERIQAALDVVGVRDVTIGHYLLTDPAGAARVDFGGSPTILIDGVDAFPGVRTNDLACRIYQTEHGLAGMPTTTQIEEAIRARL